jgi:hypothetical protein
MKTETLNQILQFSEKNFSEGEHLEVSNILKRMYENKIQDQEGWREYDCSIKILDVDLELSIEITHVKKINTDIIYRYIIVENEIEGNIKKLKRDIYLFFQGNCPTFIECNELYYDYNFESFLKIYDGISQIDTTGIPKNRRDFIDEFYKYFVDNILPTILESKITLENE